MGVLENPWVLRRLRCSTTVKCKLSKGAFIYLIMKYGNYNDYFLVYCSMIGENVFGLKIRRFCLQIENTFRLRNIHDS